MHSRRIAGLLRFNVECAWHCGVPVLAELCTARTVCACASCSRSGVRINQPCGTLSWPNKRWCFYWTSRVAAAATRCAQREKVGKQGAWRRGATKTQKRGAI